MAEVVGLVASAITLAATAQGAAQLSKVVFKVVSTFKNAPKEMNTIATELSLFSGSLQILADIINHYERLCKPQFFENTKTIMQGYREIEVDLKKLIDTDSPEKLLKLRWCMQKPKAKNLLRRIEGIKAALTLELQILQLAKEQIIQSSVTRSTPSQTSITSNRWRSVVETVVQANRQLVEDAQHEDIEDAVQKHSHAEGKRTAVDLWKEGSFDTATWLYHLVFSPSVQDPPFQATVSEESPEEQGGLVTLRSAARATPGKLPMTTREMIVWNSRTEPSYVVDKLLFTWTTLSQEQIRMTSAHQIRHDWSDRALQMLDEAKKEVDQEKILDSDAEPSDENDDDLGPPEFTQAWRARRVKPRESREPSVSRPHVRFRVPESDRPVSVPSRPANTSVPPYAPAFSDVSFDETPLDSTDTTDHRSKANVEKDPWSFSFAKGRDTGKNAGDTETQGAEEGTTASVDSTSIWSDKSGTDDWDIWGTPSFRKKSKKGTEGTKTSLPGNQKQSRQPEEKDAGPSPFLDHGEKKQAHVETGSEYDSYDDTVSLSSSSSDDTTTAIPSGRPQRRTYEGNPRNHSQTYQSGNPTLPPHPHSQPWNAFNPYPYLHRNAVPTAYPPMPPIPSPPAMPPSPAPPTVAADTRNSRLSKIERLLVAQQHSLAEMKNSQDGSRGRTELQHLSNATDGYNQTIRQLAQSLDSRNETRRQVEADVAAERKHAMAAAEDKLKIIHALEQLITRQKEDQRRAEDAWVAEKASLQQQVSRAAGSEQTALKDVAATQLAVAEMQKSLELFRAQAETEKRVRMESEVKLAEARRKMDEDNKSRFQHYEELLKASKKAQKSRELETQLPVRQTIVQDHGRSIEVNEYTAEALGPSSSSLLSPLRYFQNEPWRPEVNARYNDRSNPRRERRSSFVTSSHTQQSSGMSLAGFGSPTVQQTIVFPGRSNADNARMVRLQDSLARCGVQSAYDELHESRNNEMVLSQTVGSQLVRSTIFWEAPMLGLGSELLLTMRDLGWKFSYSRKSAGGQTYFLGDRPVHSYFFQDHYSPQFEPPTSYSQHDAVIIDKGLVEEYALAELGFVFDIAPTGEYELDGRLTFGDLENLVERSFLMKENTYRRKYRQLSRHNQVNTPNTPLTPSTRASFEDRYSTSDASSISRSSSRSYASTITGRNNDVQYETSQTSQASLDDDRSISKGSCDPAVSSTVASWVESTTNPFRTLAQDVKAKISKNPWVEEANWDGISLI